MDYHYDDVNIQGSLDVDSFLNVDSYTALHGNVFLAEDDMGYYLGADNDVSIKYNSTDDSFDINASGCTGGVCFDTRIVVEAGVKVPNGQSLLVYGAYTYGRITGGTHGITVKDFGLHVEGITRCKTLTVPYDLEGGGSLSIGANGDFRLEYSETDDVCVIRTPTSGANINILEGKVGISPFSYEFEPAGYLHIKSGEVGGGWTPPNTFNQVILEGMDNTGFCLVSPDNKTAGVIMGSPSDTLGALVSWRYDNRALYVATSNPSGRLVFMTANQVERARIDEDGHMSIGTNSPSDTGDLTLGGSGVLVLKETTKPTYEASHGQLYVRSSDGKLCFQDSTGNETVLT